MGREASSALTREYAPGTVLFEEKDPGSRMYVIRSGRVKIYRKRGDTELVLAFMGVGDFFGDMALLEGLPRSASAIVVEPSVLVEVDASTFEEMIRRNIEIAVRMMRKLSSRVRELDGRLERLLVDNNQGRAIEVLRWLMPQGILEGDWIRVKGAAAHLDIAAQAGIPPDQADAVLARLVSARCVRLDGDDLLIAHGETLDAYSSFLDLKRKYSSIAGSGPVAEQKPSQRKAVERLLGALQLNPEQIEQKQKTLASQYERFLELKDRFKGVEIAKE